MANNGTFIYEDFVEFPSEYEYAQDENSKCFNYPTRSFSTFNGLWDYRTYTVEEQTSYLLNSNGQPKFGLVRDLNVNLKGVGSVKLKHSGHFDGLHLYEKVRITSSPILNKYFYSLKCYTEKMIKDWFIRENAFSESLFRPRHETDRSRLVSLPALKDKISNHFNLMENFSASKLEPLIFNNFPTESECTQNMDYEGFPRHKLIRCTNERVVPGSEPEVISPELGERLFYGANFFAQYPPRGFSGQSSVEDQVVPEQWQAPVDGGGRGRNQHRRNLTGIPRRDQRLRRVQAVHNLSLVGRHRVRHRENRNHNPEFASRRDNLDVSEPVPLSESVSLEELCLYLPREE